MASEARRESGRTILTEDAEARGAVDHRRFLELERDRLEEVAHQPDHDRQVDRDVGDDQRGERVSSRPELLEQHVDRDDHGDRRQDALGDHPERDVVVAERALEAAADASAASSTNSASAAATAIGHGTPSADDRDDGQRARSRTNSSDGAERAAGS